MFDIWNGSREIGERGAPAVKSRMRLDRQD
jgi:hypothetical protein